MKEIPDNITIEVTRNCNLRCEFCFYRFAGKNNRKLGYLSKERILEVIKEAKKIGVKSIRFTGGEPLLRKDLIDLLKISKENGFDTILNSNGTLFNYIFIRKIENLVDSVLISLPAVNEKMEKEITGSKNLFFLRIKNIRELVRSQIPCVRTGTIISRPLLNHLDKYWRLIKLLGVKRVEFYRPMIPFKYLNLFPKYNIKPKDILKIMKFMRFLQEKGIYAYIPNAVPLCISKNKKLSIFTLKGGKFDNGNERLVLTTEGYFKPSYYIDVNLGKTISSAWNNPWLKKIREKKYLPEQCKKCPLLKICQGGSRFAAYQVFGSYFAPDPWMRKI